MEQLTGHNINVILFLKEGRGFDSFCKHPFLIEAGLENNVLDASLDSPSHEPSFCMEFWWETTKQAARRLRTAKVPLRVECYSIIDNREREKIGFVLLNLSGAYIVPTDQQSESYPTTWHKLIMCVNIEANAPRPEILLGLRIQDGGRKCQQQSFQEEICCGPLEKDQARIMRHELPDMGSNVPIVKVGPELMGIDLFSVEIVCSKVCDLDQFLSKSISQPITKAHLVYKIFGTSIKSQSSAINSESSKACVALRSSIQFLYQHLQKNPIMKVQLMSDKTELAFGELDVSNLIPINNLDVFLQRHGLSGTEVHANQIHLTPKAVDQFNLGKDTPYPYVAVVVRLQYNLPMETTIKEHDGPSNVGDFPTNHTNCKVLQAAGEIYPTGDSAIPLVQNIPYPSSNYRKPASTSHIPSTKFSKTLTSHSEPTLKGLSPREVYNRTYLLEVSIENILFHKLPAEMNFFFKFYHPKAEIFPTSCSEIFVKDVNKMVCLENIKCSFKFVTTADDISRLLISYPPNISICTSLDNQTIQLATAAIDTGRLLVEKKSSTYSLPLIDMPIGEEVGSIFVAMSLEELDYHQNDDTVLRHIVSEGGFRRHDEVAYNVAEELHIWKERQEEIFKEELMAKEKQHMDVMATEFKKRRDALQNRLHRDLLQCQMVIQTLQAAIEENRATTRKHVVMEAELKLRQDELDRRYKTKFQDLREASKRMEDDLQHRMKMVEMENNELLATNERLQKENLLLKQTIHDQEVDFDICQKGSLSKEQIASLLQETKLLQEKLKEATESKTLFKQQWARAVREIHKIKCDHQEAIQIQIRDFKQELKSLGFQRFLNEEETELREDQQLLQQMRLDVNNELSGYNDYSQKLNEMFPDSSFPDKDVTASEPALPQDEGELSTERVMMSGGAKLQQLIRERDALLRTGNFSMDHSTVHKLNHEIRKHIINPC